MSKESSTWLNQNVLIGQAAKRGKAWHYRASDQGTEPNHYDGFIPVDDVKRRLFNWEALTVPAYKGEPVLDADGAYVLDDDGNKTYAPVLDPDRQYVVASDTLEVLGNFTDEYEPHQYKEWLIHNVANVLDDDLGISSAGLLDRRGIAWVEVSLPENREVEGLAYRPNLLATTSFNGKVATQYKRTITAVVCDNTHTAALGEAGPTFKIKHIKGSSLKIAEARDALDLIIGTSKEFEDAIKKLTDVKVSDEDWDNLCAELFPEGKTDNSATRARNNREQLTNLYTYDARVVPWAGTGLGAYQAWNTMNTHMRTARGNTNRVERSMMETINGKIEEQDRPMLAAIDKLRERQSSVTIAVSDAVKIADQPKTDEVDATPADAAPVKAPAKRASTRKTAAAKS